MFVLIRAVTYASIFIGFFIIYMPSSLLADKGIAPPEMEVQQIAGMFFGAAGAVIALWCIFSFIFSGKGTPAPFDPPRRLVARGPYRFVRNPMYTGAVIVLAGAALFYESLPLLIYTVVFFIIAHVFVLLYEEPALRRKFGKEYEDYCGRTKRWLPKY